MKKYRKIQVLSIGLLFLSLAAIRYFEDILFYDPLLIYFKNNYLEAKKLPDFNLLELLASVSFRYWLNSALSLSILYIAFQKVEVIKFSLLLFTVVYCFLLAVYTYLLNDYNPEAYMKLFYVRRFLIHPLLILLLLPAFYYQIRQEDN